MVRVTFLCTCNIEKWAHRRLYEFEIPLSKIYISTRSLCAFAACARRTSSFRAQQPPSVPLASSTSIFKRGSMNPVEKRSETRWVNGVGWIAAKHLLAPLIAPTRRPNRGPMYIINIGPSPHPNRRRRPGESWRARRGPRERSAKSGSKLNCAVEMGTAVGRSEAHFR